MRILNCLMTVLLTGSVALAQPGTGKRISVTVSNEGKTPLTGATVSLYSADSSLLKTGIADATGNVIFTTLPASNYLLKVTHSGYEPTWSTAVLTQEELRTELVLRTATGNLQDVTITAKKPMVQFLPDKTVINVEASITNAGSTVMEVLEKSPGITIDRNGNISLKGRPSVVVMIDGKQTQLSGTDLQNLLSGMSASQVESIELIENPGAKYDAAGNAGIINIRTKKNRQRGLNGSLTTSYAQGILPKNNNSAVLNYRTGDLNFFLTYSSNFSYSLLDMYALRSYYLPDGSVSALLQQPYNTRTFNRSHNLRTGVDYYLSKRTTIGMAYTGTWLGRRSESKSNIEWRKPSGVLDSTISTEGVRHTKLNQSGINLNARHQFNEQRELTADIDLIRYKIGNDQYFENQVQAPGSVPEASKGDLPSTLDILSARADYSHRIKNMVWESGWKSARVETDNTASYYYNNGTGWVDDLGKSNHFLYTENIHAIYSSIDNKSGKWHWQTGLRYENTSYKARQLGNAIIKDSSFNRNYSSLFPTAFVTWEVDSSNSLTFRMGRRIDRPSFNKLNPFVFILNKYTFQKGNPFFKPQYTWNFEIDHVFKQVLSTSLTYNLTHDYFSQIFLADTTNGTIVYTEGNVGKMQNIGVSMSLQLAPKKWWSFTAQANYNHKIIEGVIWEKFKTNIDQLTLNLNNQFRFKKGWGAELSGFFISRNQNDLQEVLEPTGQVGMGISKQLFQNKATFRIIARDIFYSQDMEGLSKFEHSNEYFRLQWDSRVVGFSFVYRFGKAMKQPKRSGGAATDEMNRVGTGN